MNTKRYLLTLICLTMILPLGGCWSWKRQRVAMSAAAEDLKVENTQLRQTTKTQTQHIEKAKNLIRRLRTALKASQRNQTATVSALRIKLANAEAELQQLRSKYEVAKSEAQSSRRGANYLNRVKNVDVRIGNDGTVYASIPGSILFSSGRDGLRKNSLKTLSQVATILKNEFPSREILIEGHSDSDPIKKSKWRSNWHLSAARACSVVAYLSAKGVDSKRLSAAGFSKYRPVSSNSTKAGKSKNRRVEIAILPEGIDLTPSH